MEKRRLGRLGHESSVLVYGAAALGEVDQDEADRSIQEALDAGINHFDTAAGYGEAELRMGPWMPRIRERIFLATKTGERARDDAWAQINHSLERLQTDGVDLIQLHAVGDLDDLDRATGPGGALEAALRARDEGLVRFIGITGHGHGAPATHLEALRRFPFDTVLTPWNYTLSQRADYAADYAALVTEVRRQDAGLLTIKAVSKRNWVEDAEQRYATWYEPFDDQERISAAVAWSLSHAEMAGIATAGDTRLLGKMVRAERERAALSRDEAAEVLQRAEDYSSPFVSMPW
ncbi:MAG: aldo/keto reductase [Actinomycetota bacterium]|nr:aldo/keto reductase [Actinomycetota bacterium]